MKQCRLSQQKVTSITQAFGCFSRSGFGRLSRLARETIGLKAQEKVAVESSDHLEGGPGGIESSLMLASARLPELVRFPAA